VTRVVWSSHARFQLRCRTPVEVEDATRRIAEAIDQGDVDRRGEGRFVVRTDVADYMCGWTLGGTAACVITVLIPDGGRAA